MTNKFRKIENPGQTRAERKLILAQNRTPRGGWTKKFLASIGVGWPPPKGWKQRYIDTGRPMHRCHACGQPIPSPYLESPDG